MSEAPWPNAYLVGAPKAATTSLYRYLRQHPQVYAPETKEPHFFSEFGGSAWEDGEPDPEAREGYLDLYRGSDGAAYRLDASVSYLCDRQAPDRIAKRVPDARILASLRDPVKRAHSNYLMVRKNGHLERPLLQVLRELDRDRDDWREEYEFLRQGFYADPLERWMDRFGEDHVRVLLLPELGDEPVATLKDVARFLDVDPAPMEDVDHDVRYNPWGVSRNRVTDWIRSRDTLQQTARFLFPARVVRWVDDTFLLETEDKPDLDPRAREVLEEMYAPEVDRVEEVLDRDLPELRASWTST